MKKLFNQKHNKGITLMSLVITIIILLILAGVAIVALSGENGLLHRASEARKVSDAAGEREELEAVVKSSYDRKGDLNIDTVKTNISSSIKGATTDGATSFPLKVTYTATGNRYKVSEDGEVIQPTIIKVENTALDGNNTNGNEALKTIYGENTDYTSNNGSEWTWQLFYDDATNIYLIASDYVPGDTLPSELLTDGQYSTYCRKFTSSISDTTSPIPAGNIWKEASSATTVQGNPYLKWVGSSVDNKNNKYINMKAVAFMMDTNKWSNFAGSAQGATAIGGPTIELFALSYNAKHSTNQLGTYGTSVNDINSTNANQYGYKVKKETGSWSNSLDGLDTANATGDTGGNMWVRTASDKAYGMWVASPSSQINHSVRYMYCGGTLGGHGVNYASSGFRPVVSIPKSSIQ